MRKKQSTRGNIASQKHQPRSKSNKSNKSNKSDKSNKSNRQISRAGFRNTSVKKTVKENVVFLTEREKMDLRHQAEILKKCRDLKVICRKIDKLEKEKQKLINVIIKDVPKRKRK